MLDAHMKQSDISSPIAEKVQELFTEFQIDEWVRKDLLEVLAQRNTWATDLARLRKELASAKKSATGLLVAKVEQLRTGSFDYCRKFRKGTCSRGETCPLKHVSASMPTAADMQREIFGLVVEFSISDKIASELERTMATRAATSHEDLYQLRVALRKAEKPEAQLAIWIANKTQKCADFRLGKCSRGASCKFVHAASSEDLGKKQILNMLQNDQKQQSQIAHRAAAEAAQAAQEIEARLRGVTTCQGFRTQGAIDDGENVDNDDDSDDDDYDDVASFLDSVRSTLDSIRSTPTVSAQSARPSSSFAPAPSPNKRTGNSVVSVQERFVQARGLPRPRSRSPTRPWDSGEGEAEAWALENRGHGEFSTLARENCLSRRMPDKPNIRPTRTSIIRPTCTPVKTASIRPTCAPGSRRPCLLPTSQAPFQELPPSPYLA
eukprot:TRINITY_DN18903_c0_g1_i1.p1 TRINITY_DN18903_c0_g1~~TRINITY_DN18903_c0_g1_i1.p1  ORF type:complete len:435 (-),score=59.50 TRINITY_DN18903_c0_g1_i1:116-1420(-)